MVDGKDIIARFRQGKVEVIPELSRKQEQSFQSRKRKHRESNSKGEKLTFVIHGSS